MGRQLFWRLAIAITTLWLIAVASIAFFANRETKEIFDNSLQETAQRLLALAVRDLSAREGKEALIDSLPLPHTEYVTYQVYDSAGEMQLRSHDAPAIPYAVSHLPGFYQLEHQVYCVEMTSDGRYVIVLAEGPYHREHTLAALIISLVVPLLFLLGLTYVAMYLAIRKAGKPISDFAAEVESRHGANLTPLSVENLPREFQKIADSINSLLQRVGRALESERDFSSHCGHELRTPIAIALAQIDRARLAFAGHANSGYLDDARVALQRIGQTAEKLLQLARAESGMALDWRLINISRITELLVQDMRHTCDHRIMTRLPEENVFGYGDVDALGIVLINLLENASKYADPDTPILLELRRDATLLVENDCPPVDPLVLPRLAQRFVRGSEGHNGAGLGLAIVSALAGQMGADFELTSPCNELGRGFRVAICFRQTDHGEN